MKRGTLGTIGTVDIGLNLYKIIVLIAVLIFAGFLVFSGYDSQNILLILAGLGAAIGSVILGFSEKIGNEYKTTECSTEKETFGKLYGSK